MMLTHLMRPNGKDSIYDRFCSQPASARASPVRKPLRQPDTRIVHFDQTRLSAVIKARARIAIVSAIIH